ncbi:MAG: FtsX-like permease family protein, partial [bacterium]
MLKNLIVTGLRHLLRHRLFSLINITGLAIGIASVLLVAHFVRHELSWDRDLANGERIYRVQFNNEDGTVQQGFSPSITSEVVGQMVSTVPEIVAATRITENSTPLFLDEKVIEQPFVFVDRGYFIMLQSRVIDGTLEHPFEHNHQLVITESTAQQLFGTSQAAGKNVEMSWYNGRESFEIQAVIADRPPNSQFDYPMYIDISQLIDRYRAQETNLWGIVFSESYVMLAEGVTASEAEAQLARFPMPPSDQRRWSQYAERYALQPLFRVHLDLENRRGFTTDLPPTGILIMIAIGIAILILACINFTLLAVGLAASRFREMGVRKVMGARRGALRLQFIAETAIISFLSALIGLLLTELALPFLSPWTVGELSLRPVTFTAIVVMLTWIAATLLAAAYPAWIMASSPLVASLKGSQGVGGRGWLRKGLILGQLAVAVGMVSASLVMSRQMHYVMKRDLGYHGDQIVILDATAERGLAQSALKRLQVSLNGDPRFIGMTYASCDFGSGNWNHVGFNKEELPLNKYYENVVGPGFITLIQAQLAAGRDFRDDEADRKGAAIVNEAFVRAMGWDNPIGQTDPDLLGNTQVIGVVRDFNYHVLYEPIEPLVMMMEPETFPHTNWMWIEQYSNRPVLIYVRLSGDDIPGAMKRLAEVWKREVPESAFQASFVDEKVGVQYRSARQWNEVVTFASGLAVLIALLGLVGVTVMRVVERTKEIGIRKVLGASVRQILGLMSREIMTLVAVAGLFGGSIAAWAMSRWLQGFSYRIELGTSSFLIAGVVVLVLALSTVIGLSLRAAQMNPS